MAKMDYNLISCPFCAADVKDGRKDWLSHDKDHYFSVSCLCGAKGPRKDNKEKAIMAWNTRAYLGNESVWDPFNFQKNTNTMDIKGNIRSIGFSSVLQVLSAENKSGILQLTHGQKTSTLCLKDGQVIAASSNHGPQLGQILFEKGLISLKKLQKVLNEAKSSGRHLGETLLDRGLIKQDALKNVIRQQINQTIQGLVQWQEGLFQYRDGPIEFDERGIENISIMGMMLDALRVSDELTDTQAPEKLPNQGMTIA